MNLYVIQNTETRRYVARPGSAHSYTPKLEDARTWSTRDAAENERCVGNEIVLSVEEIMTR